MKRQVTNEWFFAWVEAEIAENRPVRFRLKGDSMLPLLRNGRDEVILVPCEVGELVPMEVVLFRYRGKHVLHRIRRREGDTLFLQGDGSFVAKEICSTSDVVGRVQEIVRPSGKIIPVTDWRWRLPSRFWWKLGTLRTSCLRMLRFWDRISHS